MSMVVWKVVEILVEGLMLEGIMMVKLLLMNMLVILQHQMEWIMLLLQVVEKRGMGMRQSYETQMNMEAWLGSMKMKNMKMNKMVTAVMIAQHFEATIKDHPKMKLREIQIKCGFEMHVNVTIDCFYRAKKIVKEKMAGNHKEEFGLLWNYAHELRYYVCFDALKRG
ncbi:hypothetical protein Godav_019688 [Gossypium davidsonii]|uniref:Uncharacterized protein n=2 Tax=Gossypium TaxID=3633 RepID=A0A7J8R0K1_GOSDV|nr:hypothetical protein [Gossypium davidsonii]MBA0642377.1 hypothetical protein [Gossypium klotzschianum]